MGRPKKVQSVELEQTNVVIPEEEVEGKITVKAYDDYDEDGNPIVFDTECAECKVPDSAEEQTATPQAVVDALNELEDIDDTVVENTNNDRDVILALIADAQKSGNKVIVDFWTNELNKLN